MKPSISKGVNYWSRLRYNALIVLRCTMVKWSNWWPLITGSRPRVPILAPEGFTEHAIRNETIDLYGAGTDVKFQSHHSSKVKE